MACYLLLEQEVKMMNQEENKITMLNPFLSFSEETVKNDPVNTISFIEIQPNQILNQRYHILQQLNVRSGEALLYTCQYQNEFYIAKVFHPENKIEEEVLKILQRIDSKFIEKVIDYFYLEDGRFVEITPYYHQGSLDNKKMSVQALKEIVIPSLNEALHILHENGLIHMDIKPANLMMSNDLSHIILIDFGSAIKVRNHQEIVVTNHSFTPVYSAIETITSNQCSIYSDYYSMGITLYELLLGHTPFNDLDKEQIVRFMQTNRIAFDDHTNLEMKDLILGLTYRDIANRNDYQNVNNRWSYQQVKDWLEGKTLIVPGEGILSNTNMIPFVINGQYYTEVDRLIEALALSWKDGIRYLSDKHLSNHFKNINHHYYEITIEFESHFFTQKGKIDKDKEFFTYIYTLLPKLNKFYFKGLVYESIQDVGFTLFDLLDNKKTKDNDFDIYEQMLKSEILSTYCQLKSIEDESLLQLIHNLELSSKINFTTVRNKTQILYALSYVLTGQKEYILDDKVFKDKDDFIDYIHEIYNKSFNDLNQLCKRLMPRRLLDVKLEAWLCSLGYLDAITLFKQKINATSQEEEIE